MVARMVVQVLLDKVIMEVAGGIPIEVPVEVELDL
jgi:hypothetical protein